MKTNRWNRQNYNNMADIEKVCLPHRTLVQKIRVFLYPLSFKEVGYDGTMVSNRLYQGR